MTSATNIPLDNVPLHITVLRSGPVGEDAVAAGIADLLDQVASPLSARDHLISPDVAHQMDIFRKALDWQRDMGLLGGGGGKSHRPSRTDSRRVPEPIEVDAREEEPDEGPAEEAPKKKKRKKHLHGKDENGKRIVEPTVDLGSPEPASNGDAVRKEKKRTKEEKKEGKESDEEAREERKKEKKRKRQEREAAETEASTPAGSPPPSDLEDAADGLLKKKKKKKKDKDRGAH
ncbi:hypothetical protein DFJ74DRAFT_674385 [Hyaloraphidium curvatum]|nr:hypothetical protein DFJ74DRAFT_674385 [Hyaloraphidium curvatum]